MISAVILRKKWIDFFADRGHLDVSNKSIIPSSKDKSLLFINSGIAAIKDYFYGNQPSPSSRLVSCQKVIRTGDIDSIGDSFRHHTYFEMLGNFSLGDYFKKEAINWAWEFLTKVLELNPNSLYVTIFKEDKEALEEWRKIIPDSKIIMGSKETNFWDMGVGPCGPCTEIYFDKGEKYDPQGMGLDLLRDNVENERYLEIWNIVFSEYLNVDGKLIKSNNKNIDTGAGLERILSILEGKENNFETSLFNPILNFLSPRLRKNKRDLWAPADYLRTCCILLNEGIVFGGRGREYVLRRIFRKSLFLLGRVRLDGDFFSRLVCVIATTLPQYGWDITFVSLAMKEEHDLYERTKEQALGLLNDLLEKYPTVIPAEEVFALVSSHGLEYWTLESILKENRRSFDREEYEDLERRHKEASFNSNISSAFTKKIPTLLEFKDPCRLDYENRSLKSTVIAVFDEDFNRVKKISSGYIVLDSTVIYPIAGGQDSDHGKIEGSEVLTSFKAPNGQILHRVKEGFREGDVVGVEHDPKRRLFLEIHHTLEHLLYELLKREVSPNLERYSGNKYEDHFNLEVRTPKEITRESFNIPEINRKLQELIDRKLEVSISSITLEESKRLGLPQNFEDVYRKSSEELRYVNIGDYSRELCFGTHVRNSEEIGSCLIVEFRKKQSNIYRFRVLGGEYAREELGDRSLEEYFSSGDEEELRRIKAEKRKEFQQNKKLLMDEIMGGKEELMVMEREVEVELALEAFKELGRRISGRTVVLYFRENDSTRFFMVSDLVDVGVVMKNLREKYGWKCGGNAGFGSGVGEVEGFRERFLECIRT